MKRARAPIIDVEQLPRLEDHYTLGKRLGGGVFGAVFEAQCIADPQSPPVAVKKLLRPLSTHRRKHDWYNQREYEVVRACDHINIIKLHAMYTTAQQEGGLCFVFEMTQHDLRGVISSSAGANMSLGQIKGYTQQMLRALEHIHARNIMHRDIKPENILLASDGNIKLADFGLATRFGTDKDEEEGGGGEYAGHTGDVQTYWYRAPEVCAGLAYAQSRGESRLRCYGCAIDIWSVGCVLAELITGQALIRAPQESEQLKYIWSLCGTPDINDWPPYLQISVHGTFGEHIIARAGFADRFIAQVISAPRLVRPSLYAKPTIVFVQRLLDINQKTRPTAAQALQDAFLTAEQPLPYADTRMIHYVGCYRGVEPAAAKMFHQQQSAASATATKASRKK